MYRVDSARTVTIEVPITLSGTSNAIVNMGGTLIQPLSSVTVQGLPLDIPTEFVIDISILDGFEKSILISDIEVAESIT